MSDSFVQLSPDSSGKKMDTRTEGTNAEHRQVMVLGDPATNAGVAPVDATKGLAVDLSATGANSNKLLVTPDLPSGASTAAKQPALGTAGTASADVITVQGITSMTALKTDSSATTQPVSGTVTANAGTNLNTSALALDATLTGGTQKAIVTDGTNSVSVTTAGADATSNTFNGLRTSAHGKIYNGTTWDRMPGDATNGVYVNVKAGSIAVTQSTAASLNATVTPANATAASIPSVANPSGNEIRTSEKTAMTNAQLGISVMDKTGKQIVLPYANPENFTTGTANTTGTSDTSVVSAPGASLFIYITDVIVVNTGGTTTLLTIKSGSGGSTLIQTIAPAGGGSNVKLTTPIKMANSATAVYFACANASTTVYCTVSGYIGV